MLCMLPTRWHQTMQVCPLSSSSPSCYHAGSCMKLSRRKRICRSWPHAACQVHLLPHVTWASSVLMQTLSWWCTMCAPWTLAQLQSDKECTAPTLSPVLLQALSLSCTMRARWTAPQSRGYPCPSVCPTASTATTWGRPSCSSSRSRPTCPFGAPLAPCCSLCRRTSAEQQQQQQGPFHLPI